MHTITRSYSLRLEYSIYSYCTLHNLIIYSLSRTALLFLSLSVCWSAHFFFLPCLNTSLVANPDPQLSPRTALPLLFTYIVTIDLQVSFFLLFLGHDKNTIGQARQQLHIGNSLIVPTWYSSSLSCCKPRPSALART